MIKVKYNIDKKKLNAAYLKLFEKDSKDKQKKWSKIRKEINSHFTSLPSKIKDIMVADFKALTPIYLEYQAMMNTDKLTDTQKEDIKQKLEEIFDYTNFDSDSGEIGTGSNYSGGQQGIRTASEQR